MKDELPRLVSAQYAGWMASLIRWTWVWASSRSWWWTGKPGVLQSMGSQSRTQLAELNWNFWSLEQFLNLSYPSGSDSKESACNAMQDHVPGGAVWTDSASGCPETRVWLLGGDDPLEKGMATHSSILAWRIPWTEPGGLQSMGLERIGLSS